MKHVAVVNAAGEILYTVFLSEGAQELSDLPQGERQVELPPDSESMDNFVGRLIWVDTGWQVRPPHPDYPAYWDAAAGAWQWDRDVHIAGAKREVDLVAESARTKYITPGAGQALEYEAAQREAEAFLSGRARARFPMLQADVDAGMAPDLQTAAEHVVAARDQWETVGAIIRRQRLQAKRRLDQAQAPQAVQALVIKLKAELETVE